MATTRVDDVEDSSVLRRGIPVANSIFGTAQTINSANYVYFKALADVVSLGNPKLIDIFTEELINLHRGQGMELYWRDSLTCPSEEDYLEMVGNKTGGLFRLAIKLMQAESSVDMYVPFPLLSSTGSMWPVLTNLQRLHTPRLHRRRPLPDPRRPPQPLPHLGLRLPQGPLRGPDRGQILLPRHPRHPRRPGEPRPHEYPEAEDERRGGEEVRHSLHGGEG